ERGPKLAVRDIEPADDGLRFLVIDESPGSDPGAVGGLDEIRPPEIAAQILPSPFAIRRRAAAKHGAIRIAVPALQAEHRVAVKNKRRFRGLRHAEGRDALVLDAVDALIESGAELTRSAFGLGIPGIGDAVGRAFVPGDAPQPVEALEDAPRRGPLAPILGK